MLKKVVLENFRCYKNSTVFDLEATKYQTLQETNVKNGVLKGAMIIGPNASGKSTLIQSIKLLLDLMFADNFTVNPLYGCLFGKAKNISLKYQFLIDNKTVVYGFDIDYNGNIVYEELSVDGVVQLERKGMDGKILTDMSTNIMADKFSETVLLLRKCYFSDMFADNAIVTKFMAFLNNSAYINAHDKVIAAYNTRTRFISEADDNALAEINSLFTKLNLGFEITKEKEKPISEFGDDGKVSRYVLKTDSPIVFFKRNDMKLNLPLYMESTGNQTLAQIILSVYNCCKENSILLIDEFSSGFHNKLEELIIRYLFANMNESQIIFTSHSTNLLNTKLLRPDQIYTVTFKANDGAYIERFSDETPREAQNLEKMYLSGKFGALPDYSYED